MRVSRPVAIRGALVALVVILSCTAAAVSRRVLLPGGWWLEGAVGPVATTGTMPQGIALSPDGSSLAVVESGFNPPALRILSAPDLKPQKALRLAGAFGKPLWIDGSHVLVAGANADAILEVNLLSASVVTIPTGKGTWPAAVALSPDRSLVAAADDGTGMVTIAAFPSGANARSIRVGDHPSDVVFSKDGRTLYVAARGESEVDAVAVASGAVTRIPMGLHPSALALSADGSSLYVVETDDDSVGVIDTASGKRRQDINVGLHDGRLSGYGASPNALVERNGLLYVSLGAENAVAVISNGRVIARVPTGWYPTGVALGSDGTLYVSDGKGEGTRANPQFNPLVKNANRPSRGYVAATLFGSVRAIPFADYTKGNAASDTAAVLANAMPTWKAPPRSQTVIRSGGPIRHVIYIIKENRSYDEVLGDISAADGDPALVWFGKRITPNQHAIAERFGVFDRAFTNSQVSADGHNWTDAAFANDYVERFWPPNYGGRRKLWDFQDGRGADTPHGGYLWDAAARAHVSYRDYGEDLVPANDIEKPPTQFLALRGHFDPHYVGWNLKYSDAKRFAEWQSEFEGFVRHRDLPQLEIVYIPNDHTAGTAPGYPTPQAYVAINDSAVGRLVDDVSHSRYWKSTAIFALEDDAQDGPDHVSDQRSTFYVASPYAKTGVHHEQYTTAGVVHTIELILGLKPLSIYDATALPMYAAFDTRPDLRPFDAIPPQIDVDAVNLKTAYDARASAALDFHDPDETNPAILNNIIAHAVHNVRSLRYQGR